MLRLPPKKVITRSRFSLSEDAKLRDLVHSMGGKAWDEIASAMPGRSARQCRDSFQNYLADDINRQPWTPCEDALLSRQYQRIGRKWAEISRSINGRTGNDGKNRWYKHVCKSASGRGSDPGRVMEANAGTPQKGPSDPLPAANCSSVD
jgi:hypothetical protein